MVGGGGGGAGVNGNAGNAACGGGGAGGGYCEHVVAVTPSTGYTVVIGGGGAGGVNDLGGTAGTNSTIAIGASTWTAQGGTFGTNMANGLSIALTRGGAQTPANVANAPNLAVGGEGGGPSQRQSGTSLSSGQGGDSLLGAGGSAITQNVATAGTVGVAGSNFGGGGGGACGNSAALGGAGAQGGIIIEEYS